MLPTSQSHCTNMHSSPSLEQQLSINNSAENHFSLPKPITVSPFVSPNHL